MNTPKNQDNIQAWSNCSHERKDKFHMIIQEHNQLFLETFEFYRADDELLNRFKQR